MRISTVVLVLDTSSIINGYPTADPAEKYTVPEVVEEARSTTAAASIGILIDSGDLKVWGASPGSVERVNEKLEEIGGELSPTDVRLAALTIDLAERGMEPVLMTDDYGLQNLARTMNLGFRSVATPGIKSVFHWEMTCPACGKTWDGDLVTCPECGNRLQRRVSRRRL